MNSNSKQFHVNIITILYLSMTYYTHINRLNIDRLIFYLILIFNALSESSTVKLHMLSKYDTLLRTWM